MSLIERVPHGVELTPAGLEMVEHFREMGEAANRYASPEYLQALGNPETLEVFSRADFIGFDRKDALMDGLNALGFSLTASNFPIVTENQLVQWELCKQGAGICVMVEEVGEAEPRVQRVLPNLAPIPVPMWLVSHREVRMSRRVRVVFDALADGYPLASRFSRCSAWRPRYR